MTSLRRSSANFGLYFFIISFLFIGHFIFGNLFVAVVIEQIDRATAGYQKRIETKKATVIYRKKKKAKNVQESEIKNIINQMKSGDFKSFPRAVLDMYKHVRKDEFKLKSDIKCLPLWVETFSQEYSRLASRYKDIRDYNLEMVECLGRLLNDMDQSVQAILMERAVQEQALFRRKSRSVSFIRRLSQRMSIFGRPKSGRNLLGDPITSYPNLPLETIEIVHSEPTFKESCISCLGFFENCQCTNPEIESRAIEEEINGRASRLYSSNTSRWLGEPSSGPRLSTVSQRSSYSVQSHASKRNSKSSTHSGKL